MIATKLAPPKKHPQTKMILAWFGLLPLALFGLSFQLVPVAMLVKSSLFSGGSFTLQYFQKAFTPSIIESFKNTFSLSLTTAVLGVIFGSLVAFAIISSPNKFIRNSLTALADVTTNFGGAPLAFAFIIVLGSTGVVTMVLKAIGVNLYPAFRIYSISGLTVAYLYFQIPLMILLVIPSMLGIKKEWWEAAINLGADSGKFWWHIGLPYLIPSLLSGFLLLFANSFGAYATAWTLTGPDVNLVTVQIAALIRGEVQLQPEMADALAVVSLLIMSFCVLGYLLLSRKSRKG
jgi:putative spermidine/putrescine transport system permease protein